MRLGILACSKTKAPEPRRAIELYQGRTFRAAAGVLRARGCVRLVILSALHGAIEGDTVIAPYELALASLRAAERAAWATRTATELRALLPAHADVLAIVPALYAPALSDLPRVERLFAGLPQGRLYSALAKELRS